jgi:hypothetical protein
MLCGIKLEATTRDLFGLEGFDALDPRACGNCLSQAKRLEEWRPSITYREAAWA